MKLRATSDKIVGLKAAAAARARARRQKKKVVFTNGCFDLLHAGHVEYLEAARRAGDMLVVGLNDDASVRRLKGPLRPLQPGRDRARLLAALAAVDLVVFFREDTPDSIVRALQPDVLVKGADWKPGTIVGADTVLAGGGKVVRVRLKPGVSTSALVEKIRSGAASKSGDGRDGLAAGLLEEAQATAQPAREVVSATPKTGPPPAARSARQRRRR